MSEKERSTLDQAKSIQEENLQAISDAIKEKRGITETIDAKDFAEEIRKIETGSVLPTLTNPAEARDTATGKQFINQNGSVVTGTIPQVESGSTFSLGSGTLTQSGSSILLQKTVSSDEIFRSGANISVTSPLSNFGTAETADVASGKIFTSTNGLKLTGTMPNVGDLIQDTFSAIGSSLNTISEIRKAFNYASFGFNADHQPVESQSPFEPFMNITISPALYMVVNTSGELNCTWGTNSNGLYIMVPDSIYPPPDTDPFKLLNINRYWTGIAFIYLSEYYLSLHNYMSEEHMIGGYILKESAGGKYQKFAYLTMPANSKTIVQHQGDYDGASNASILSIELRDCATYNAVGIKQVIYGHGAYFRIYVNPTDISPLPGEYLTLVW